MNKMREWEVVASQGATTTARLLTPYGFIYRTTLEYSGMAPVMHQVFVPFPIEDVAAPQDGEENRSTTAST